MSFVQLQKRNASADDTIFELIGLYAGVIQSTRENLVKEGKPIPAALNLALDAIRCYQMNQYNGPRGRTVSD